MLLDSGPLAVEGVVGRALKALRADAGVEAAGSGVAENGERRRGAGGGAEAEHCVVGITGCVGSGDVVRGCAGSSRKSVLDVREVDGFGFDRGGVPEEFDDQPAGDAML